MTGQSRTRDLIPAQGRAPVAPTLTSWLVLALSLSATLRGWRVAVAQHATTISRDAPLWILSLGPTISLLVFGIVVVLPGATERPDDE